MNQIDLHVHSIYSDGTLSTAELLKLAEETGLSAFALTDHDCTAGVEELLKLSADSPVEIVPGIEISSYCFEKEIHVLGYYINYAGDEMKSFLANLVERREERNRKMCERLREAGLSISYEALRGSLPAETVLTRMHFARFLYNAGDVSSIDEAFGRYLGDRCPTYVQMEKISPEEAIRFIRSVGGVPVLAHPIFYGFSDARLETLIASLKEAGLAGIETVYSTYLPADERKIRKLAKKYNLIMTGGSDFHGSNKPHIKLGKGMGRLFVPEEFLDEIKKEYLKNYKTTNPSGNLPGLLSFDMDGTLLNDNKEITPATRLALEETLAKGYAFTISTGRPLTSILRLIDGLDLRKYKPLISAFNGGCIYDLDRKEMIYRNVLDSGVAAEIAAMAREAKLHFHTYTDREVISERDTEELRFYSGYVNMEYRICEDVIKEEPAPFKIIIMHLTDKKYLDAMQEKILGKYGHLVQCIFSNDKFLEVIPKTSGKDVALRKMCELYDVPFESSYAFADQDNDISMLAGAAHGVALVNGSEGAKKAADYITFLDNNHDGLVPFLKILSES